MRFNLTRANMAVCGVQCNLENKGNMSCCTLQRQNSDTLLGGDLNNFQFVLRRLTKGFFKMKTSIKSAVSFCLHREMVHKEAPFQIPAEDSFVQFSKVEKLKTELFLLGTNKDATETSNSLRK